MQPAVEFPCTNCAGPTIALMGTICILFFCFTSQLNPSALSAQPWRSLNFNGIATAYSGTWGCITHCWVFFHYLQKVDIAYPAARRPWYCRIWFGRVQLKYDTRKEGILHWKVLLRSFSSLCIYWTQMLWALDMIPQLALVYWTLQSSSRRSTDVGQWNRWQ